MTSRTIMVASLLMLAGAGERLVAQNPIDDVTTQSSRARAARGDSTPEGVTKAGAVLPKAAVVSGTAFPEKEADRVEYLGAIQRAKYALFVWFVLVLLYLVWAIHRYVYNYGLSNREWKVLYPAVYETWFDRAVASALGSKTYEQRRDDLDSYRQRQRESATDSLVNLPAASITRLLDEPDKNPYQGDSFGLPPGTIRGIIALTALVLFGVIEFVNLHSGATEQQFGGLVLALQMVLAFYFGSRAVEVFQAKAAERKAEAESGAAAESEPEGRAAAAARPATPVVRAPEEPAGRMALPENKTLARFANLVAAARGNGPGTAKTGTQAALPAPVTLTATMPLELRVLALTAAFETGSRGTDGFGAIAGDFDGQGISFGALQWNLGQRSLQPLWKEMRDKHPEQLAKIMGDQLQSFNKMLGDPQGEQMAWARNIQHMAPGRTNAWTIVQPWKSRLQALGRCEEMIKIQVSAASHYYSAALTFCDEYGLDTQRGAALMFDIAVQNGTVDRGGAGAAIRDDFELISPYLSAEEQEVERMRIIARRRAQVARKEWQSDVLARKMTIAEGSGIVHGRRFDLEDDFGIGLAPLHSVA